MKFILLAATAMLAVPAIAQDAQAPAGSATMQAPATTATPTTADPAQTSDPATTPAPGTPATTDGSSMQGGSGMQSDTTAQGGMTTQGQSMPADTTGATPMGGYQPTGPALSGTATPGVQPTFTAARSPSEAYPAPAPMAKYPICKKGQYDKCMQRGGR